MRKKRGFVVTTAGQLLVALGGWRGTEGLVWWRPAGLPRPELSRPGLSMLKGRTHVQASCREGAAPLVGVNRAGD